MPEVSPATSTGSADRSTGLYLLCTEASGRIRPDPFERMPADVADADVPDVALGAQLRERASGVLDRDDRVEGVELV